MEIHRTNILILIGIGIFTVYGYNQFNDLESIDWMLWYLSYPPNTYRLFEQMLLLIQNGILNINLLLAISWIFCIMLTVILVQPHDNDLLLLLIMIMWTSILFIIRQSPMYPIIALIFLNSKNQKILWLMIPLVMIKEVALYTVVIGIVLFQPERCRSAIIPSSASAVVYLCIRFFIVGDGQYAPGQSPFFTPAYVINTILSDPVGFIVLYIIPMILMLCLVPKSKKELFFLVLTAIPILLFGLFWEPQLWIPAFIVILISRKKIKKE